MSKLSNLNYNRNNISVKTDSTVKLIQELSKLGVFKKKTKKRPKSSVAGSIRQDNEMLGYVSSLGGPQMRNIGPLQIQAGMSQNQIEDIQRRNDATFAALRGEVQQQRLEDIEAQQGQRFADISKLSEIINPVLERFRGAQQPGAGQRNDPFTIPDTTEERFTETLNEGGPEAVEERQTGIYAGGDLPEGVAFAQIGDVIPESRIQPDQKIGGAANEEIPNINIRKPGGVGDFYLSKQKMKEIQDYWGLGPIPETREVRPLREYLVRVNSAIGSVYSVNVPREELMKNIRKALKEAWEKIDWEPNQ